MDGQYRVVVSNRAAKMLTAHAGFLARCGETAARAFGTEFQKAAQSLSQLPQRNPVLKSDVLPSGKYYKMIFAKRYLLVYQMKKDTVMIEYVIDCRQDYAWLLPGI